MQASLVLDDGTVWDGKGSDIMERVGLPSSMERRKPHDHNRNMSGGEQATAE